MGVRWYVAYAISYQQLEEMMQERGVAVDHATLNRWVIKYAPEFEKQFRRRQQPVGKSWRMDETYVRIKGQWKYLYRAVDKEGQTVDFLLTPHRDRAAAEAFLYKAIHTHGLPEKITIDQSGSNTAAINHYNKMHKTTIAIRQSKHLNNLVAQDHRAVKRLGRPRLGFQSFWAACCTLAGIDVMHAIRKGQLLPPRHGSHTPAEQFYASVAWIIKSDNFARLHLKFATKPSPATGRRVVPRDCPGLWVCNRYVRSGGRSCPYLSGFSPTVLDREGGRDYRVDRTMHQRNLERLRDAAAFAELGDVENLEGVTPVTRTI